MIQIPDERTLAEWIATATDVCHQELGQHRDPDPAFLASMIQVAATPPPEGGSKEAMVRVVRLSDEWKGRQAQSSLSPVALPDPPTREWVCGIQTHFQGIWYDTEFGRIPGAFLDCLSSADFQAALDTHLAAGDHHVTMNLTGAYMEPGTVYPPKLMEGHDWTQDLKGIKAKVRHAIVKGLCVDFALGGDGRSVSFDPQPGQYNDPVGHTYGYEWLIRNLPRILFAFQGAPGSECPDGEDLTRYVIFRPGYDGVFYGWGDPPGQPDRQPERVLAFGKLFRDLLPTGYLGLEHGIGTIPVGEGGREFSSGMQAFDSILSEFPNWPDTGDPVWQVAGRLLGPQYRRPHDQPPGDDPHPPWYLGPGTPRGPYFAVAFEFAKFPESRGKISPEEVERARQYYRSLGYVYVG